MFSTIFSIISTDSQATSTARYHRSLGLLWEAVEHANRAYIFDNSSAEAEWVAER